MSIHRATVVLLLVALATSSSTSADEPFEPGELDIVHSDAVSVRYDVPRTCLADGTGCPDVSPTPSACGLGHSLTGLSCHVGIHRFCGALGHASGYGVETLGDPSRVEITCLRPDAVTVDLVDHSTLAAKHGGCTNALPSVACDTAIDRYCRALPGYRVGFGPVERSATEALVTCIEDDATTGPFPTSAEVEALVPGCSLGGTPTSTECRQAMDLYCESLDSNLRGGFGPREMGTTLALGCVRQTETWARDTAFPQSPALPVDILTRSIDLATGTYEPTYNHAALAPARATSFDGRFVLGGTGTVLRFTMQTPEIFPEPLSQTQPANQDRSFESGFWGEQYAFDVAASSFHGSSVGALAIQNIAVCDPHLGVGTFAQLNRQQSQPGRISNPFACDSDGDSLGTLDHDCYDLTILAVHNTVPQEVTPQFDELWGTPVRIVVKNPKGAGLNTQNSFATRAHVVDVQILGTPQKAPLPSQSIDILEPVASGDGRLLVAQVNGSIQYTVMQATDTACDVTNWEVFKHLSDMHTDLDMADYGLAKYPLRDPSGEIVPAGSEVSGAYPWIDRDGDNLLFAMGKGTFFYVDPQDVVQARFPVVDHPYHGATTCDGATEEDCPIKLRPTTEDQVEDATAPNRRVGLTLVGLWSHGKMFSPDNRNNSADFGIPDGFAHHRNVHLYSDVPAGTETASTVRTGNGSTENQFFFLPNLQPDMPREVVWQLSTQSMTDEVAFDDVNDPRALLVAPMNVPIVAAGGERGWFLDGFEYDPGNKYGGSGFTSPPRIANIATPVSDAVAATTPALAGNVQWNPPASGRLLGGARSEPIAAGGFRGKGVWLDGDDDRLEFIVPEQPPATAQEMADGTWFYNLSFDPRNLATSQRLLSLPDGTWLDLVDAQTLRLGRGSTVHDVSIPSALSPTVREWTTVGVVSRPDGGAGFDLDIYLDGYLLSSLSPAANLFRMGPGLLTVGAENGGLEGWIDDLKVIGRDPGPEVVCNHARGTLIGVEAGDPLETLAAAYPSSSHAALSAQLPIERQFASYACERPITDPVDGSDLLDHTHYTCLGQTRRLEGLAHADRCLRHDLLFGEGPLFHDAPRPSSLTNAFCTSCHVDSNPSQTMRATDALAPDLMIMHDDTRRQPMQSSPKIFGVVPAWLFGDAPSTQLVTPAAGLNLDQYVTPAEP